MTSEFLADTYAYIEILRKNPRYQRYKDAKLFTTTIHLSELIYYFLRVGEEKRVSLVKKLFGDCVHIQFSTIISAMKFKLANKKHKLSYADCIGYALACELNIPFLTGDEKFEGLANVEFIK